MSLDDTQKEIVKGWVRDGLKLSEIQSRISAELKVSLTYMEVRFLVDDLGVQLRDESNNEPNSQAGSKSEKSAPGSKDRDDGEEAAELLPEEEPFPPGLAKVKLSVDTITRPGAMVSGKVTFGDGVKAEWHLDQFGRLGLSPEKEGYRPTEDDVMAFQMELQAQLQKSGF